MFSLQNRFSAKNVLILVVLVVAGCEASEVEVQNEQSNATPSNEDPTTLNEQPSEQTKAPSATTKGSDVETSLQQVFQAWDSGAKDDAVTNLLKVDWENPMAIEAIHVMGISEKEFMAQSSDAKQETQADAMKLAGDSKAILRHAFSLAEQAEAEGDTAKAKQYFEAVRRLGNALANTDRLTVLQMMGKSLVQMADEKLAPRE